MNKVLMLVGMLVLAGGCIGTDSVQSGRSQVEIKDMAKNHSAAVGDISKSGKYVASHAKKPDVIEAGLDIVESAASIDDIAATMIAELKIKNALLEQNEKLNKKINSKRVKVFGYVLLSAKVLGLLLIPLGIVAAVRFGKFCLGLSAFGILLIVTAYMVAFMEAYWWVVAIAGLVAVVWFVIAFMMNQDEVVSDAVKFGETLKGIVKESAPDELEALVGYNLVPGTITQAPHVIKQIARTRKKIAANAAHIGK